MAPPIRRPKQSSAPSTTPIPTSTVVGEFMVDGALCELLRVHGPSDQMLSTKEMLRRGDSADAYMRAVDGNFLRNHQRELPSDFSKFTLLFPLWTGKKDGEDDELVRTLDMKNVTWWCVVAHPNTTDWNADCLLVRFGPLRLQAGR